jgi:hypothetical protein
MSKSEFKSHNSAPNSIELRLYVAGQTPKSQSAISKLPIPIRKIIGGLSDTEWVLLGLDIHGSDKKSKKSRALMKTSWASNSHLANRQGTDGCF